MSIRELAFLWGEFRSEWDINNPAKDLDGKIIKGTKRPFFDDFMDWLYKKYR